MRGFLPLLTLLLAGCHWFNEPALEVYATIPAPFLEIGQPHDVALNVYPTPTEPYYYLVVAGNVPRYRTVAVVPPARVSITINEKIVGELQLVVQDLKGHTVAESEKVPFVTESRTTPFVVQRTPMSWIVTFNPLQMPQAFSVSFDGVRYGYFTPDEQVWLPIRSRNDMTVTRLDADGRETEDRKTYTLKE